MLHRLQKILARAGIASRRSAEAVIQAGRVRVNGKVVTELGTRADPRTDKIEVDGKRIVAEDPVYVLLHKPRGYVSTLHDPEGRPTVADLVQTLPLRLFPVGRLDFQTSGALLLTNDGDFTARMLHPRHDVPKTYLVKVRGEWSEQDLEPWRTGVELEDGRTLPAEVFLSKRERGFTWFEIILREGRNQQIRRMGEATGCPVVRLTRTAFAHLGIDGMRSGQWRFLSLDELRDLRSMYGEPKRIRAAAAAHTELARLQPSPERPRRYPKRASAAAASADRSGVRSKPRLPKPDDAGHSGSGPKPTSKRQGRRRPAKPPKR